MICARGTLVVLLACGGVIAQTQPVVPVAAPAAPQVGPAAGNGDGALDDGVPTAGLVAHWAFDERRGLLAQEPVGNHVGLIQGAQRTWEAPGPALVFDGDDDQVVLPQTAVDAVSALDQGSIALWFRFEDEFALEPIQPLLHFGIDDPADPDSIISIEVGHNFVLNRRLYITWTIQNQISLCFDNGSSLDPGVWHHFVAVVGPNGNTGYLNGVEMVDRVYNAGGPNDRLFFADIPSQEWLRLGHGKTFDAVSPQFEFLQGGLADVRIYDRPLSAEEVGAIYNRAPPRPTSGATATAGG